MVISRLTKFGHLPPPPLEILLAAVEMLGLNYEMKSSRRRKGRGGASRSGRARRGFADLSEPLGFATSRLRNARSTVLFLVSGEARAGLFSGSQKRTALYLTMFDLHPQHQKLLEEFRPIGSTLGTLGFRTQYAPSFELHHGPHVARRLSLRAM